VGNDEYLRLCLSLMNADSEAEVIDILTKANLWDEPDAWRYYGDYENNYNTIGNQQGKPDAALVEKLVNSIDARLLLDCLARGIDPESPLAPQSIREAVALFFENSSPPHKGSAGRLKNWTVAKRTEVSKGITLTATGFGPSQGNPCLTIADCGEGQTPTMMPKTFLSLTKSNKLRIPFVQGKFNMGGTGALKFCGYNNIQLIVSKRPPVLVNNTSNPSDSQWGFSVVRRENPEGNRRSSVYTYLAPLNADIKPKQGEVLRFSADTLPLFPEGTEPYARESEWGTLVKLYEYALQGRSHILMKDGLLRRVDLLLPELALPIRFYECRENYTKKGHGGSHETTVYGLSVRLEDDKQKNLEQDVQSSFLISVGDQQIRATVFAFKKDRADTYRKNEGIIFTINGQTHGHLGTDFFRRRSVNLPLLKDSLLVILDCTSFSNRAREDLFMNSRDRLSGGNLRVELEHALEDLLKNHQGLRDLKEKRRKEELESKLSDNKPLEGILEKILKNSPSLATLLLQGTRLSTPFKPDKVRADGKPYKGKKYPTYFRFKGKDYGKELVRDCHINMRCRVSFETDATNDYFNRDDDKGEFSLSLMVKNKWQPVTGFAINLFNGIGTLSFRLPADCSVGDALSYKTMVDDPVQINPFENKLSVNIKEEVQRQGGKTSRRKPPGSEKGPERDKPAGIALPNITEIYADDWIKQSPPFDKFTALRVINGGSIDDEPGEDDTQNAYYFHINMDNVFLQQELKRGKTDDSICRTRFSCGMVLIGLALLQDDLQQQDKGREEAAASEEDKEVPIEDRIEQFTKAVAPILLPTIESLGGLEVEIG